MPRFLIVSLVALLGLAGCVEHQDQVEVDGRSADEVAEPTEGL